MSTTSFRLIEYTGDDAGEVLISLLVNLEKVDELQVEEVEDSDDGPATETKVAKPTKQGVGFQPNIAYEEEDDDE